MEITKWSGGTKIMKWRRYEEINKEIGDRELSGDIAGVFLLIFCRGLNGLLGCRL